MKPHTVAFTGSREFADGRLVEWIIKRLVHKYPSSPEGAGLVVKVGDARGADRLVCLECPRWGVWPSVQVCDWPENGTKQERWQAAHERNGRVVAGADLVIALRAPGPLTPGTSDAIEQAMDLEIPVYIYHEGRWFRPN
jgi:hypothetical protein